MISGALSVEGCYTTVNKQCVVAQAAFAGISGSAHSGAFIQCVCWCRNTRHKLTLLACRPVGEHHEVMPKLGARHQRSACCSASLGVQDMSCPCCPGCPVLRTCSQWDSRPLTVSPWLWRLLETSIEPFGNISGESIFVSRGKQLLSNSTGLWH